MDAPKQLTVVRGLRFDKVATRVIERLQAALGDIVPERMTVVIAITAPIRLPAKTAAALEAKVATFFDRKWPRRDYQATINGNHVRIRLLKDQPARAPKLIGFVHNPDTDPLLLLEMGGTRLSAGLKKALRSHS